MGSFILGVILLPFAILAIIFSAVMVAIFISIVYDVIATKK